MADVAHMRLGAGGMRPMWSKDRAALRKVGCIGQVVHGGVCTPKTGLADGAVTSSFYFGTSVLF